MSILQICEWIGNTSVSVGIRESIWTYPIIESLHSVGIALFIGLLLIWLTASGVTRPINSVAEMLKKERAGRERPSIIAAE